MLTLRRMDAARGALGRLIDAVGQPAALYGLDGRQQHETPALTALLACEPERERLAAAVRRVVAEVARLVRGERRGSGSAIGPGPTNITMTERACYRVAAVVAPDELTNGMPCILVTVSVEGRVVKPLPSIMELSHRFLLTPREAQVALLLATGSTVVAIAASLHVSPHTVRRHIEHVYQKLGVHTRVEVGAALRGDTGDGLHSRRG
jgi:DNA-binding CsgD family transcriptional regulator